MSFVRRRRRRRRQCGWASDRARNKREKRKMTWCSALSRLFARSPLIHNFSPSLATLLPVTLLTTTLTTTGVSPLPSPPLSSPLPFSRTAPSLNIAPSPFHLPLLTPAEQHPVKPSDESFQAEQSRKGEGQGFDAGSCNSGRRRRGRTRAGGLLGQGRDEQEQYSTRAGGLSDVVDPCTLVLS